MLHCYDALCLSPGGIFLKKLVLFDSYFAAVTTTTYAKQWWWNLDLKFCTTDVSNICVKYLLDFANLYYPVTVMNKLFLGASPTILEPFGYCLCLYDMSDKYHLFCLGSFCFKTATFGALCDRLSCRNSKTIQKHV